MKASCLYGSSFGDLAATKVQLEDLLGARLEAHESSYRGGEYFVSTSTGVKLILQRNFTDEDGELAEPQFSNALILLYLDGMEEQVKEVASRIISQPGSYDLLRQDFY